MCTGSPRLLTDTLQHEVQICKFTILLWYRLTIEVQVPANLLDYNKGNIHMAKSSPRCVYEAYFSQFEKDFTTFLRMRSEEVIPNGRMVLSLVGRSSADHTMKDSCYMYGLLGKSLLDMSAEV